MSWQTLLGSAVIAAVISVLGGMLTKVFVDAHLETVKSELNRELEVVKSELSVWATFRNDTIKEMWDTHRQIVSAMTKVILQIQTAEPALLNEAAAPAVEEYRRTIHQHIDLLSPEDVMICQQFLDMAREITTGGRSPDDANPLKAIRRKFYEQMVAFFHLDEVMPWMSRESSPQGDSP